MKSVKILELHKYIYSFLLILILYQNCSAQDNDSLIFLPLTIGNEYQFVSRYPPHRYFSGIIERDTIYPNMKRYFTVPYFFEFGDCRIDCNGNLLSASKPFFYDGQPEEYLLFKADALVGEQWAVAWDFNPIIDTGYARCFFDDSLYVFGVKKRVKGIQIFDEHITNYSFLLAEGIGMISNRYDDPESIIDLNYAKISGVEYGKFVTVEEDVKSFSIEFNVSQNYPNPFNSQTTILYDVKEKGFVQLKIYDILGNEVAVLVNELKDQGRYNIDFNANFLSSGVYIYTLRVNDFIQHRKMTFLK